MPLQKLVFKPGINKEGTNYTNEGGWFDCDKVRFRSGNAEKIGGWTRLSNNTFVGVCRALWNWGTLTGANLLGVGTSKKYYVEQGGVYNDITPLLLNGSGGTTTTLGANALGTTNGSTAVTINDAISGISPSIGDYIILTSTATVGGLTIAGEYTVSKVNNSLQYEITASAAATSTATGGGTVTVQYEYPVGNDTYTTSTGWGAGSWSPTNIVNLGANPFTVTAGSAVVTVTQNSHGYLTSAGSFVVGQQYKIVAIGSTDFTLIGASANTVGTVFTATGVGTGSGTASIAWVAFTGVTNLTATPTSFSISGTSGFRTGTYGMYGVTATSIAVPAAWLNSTFELTYVNANTYTVTMVAPAVYGAVSGGSAVIAYPQYGARPWNSAADIGIAQQLRIWTNDNFGQDLVIAPRGGGLYYWAATSGVYSRALLLNTVSTSNGFLGQFVPNTTNQVLGSAIQRFVVAFGSNPYDPADPDTAFDPLLVRWSDQENPYEWVPAVTNQSGEYRLNIGSYIVCGRSTRQEILVWTDAAIYSMQYLGPPYVWGFQLLQDNISIMGPNASITVNNVTYWMGTDKFYRYTGRVETLPSTLRQYVYQDINQNQNFQVYAGSVEGYNEIWWFYCSANSDIVNRYVIYNYVDDVWYYGNMARTAWLDSGLRTYPMGADAANFRVLYHENGVDDVSGLTAVPIVSYVQSSDFDIGDGHNFGFVWRILPDLTFNGSTSGVPEVTMVVLPRVNAGTAYGTPNAPAVASAQNYSNQKTYAVQQFTGQVYTRIRGRQMAYRIESDGLGVAWQMGYPRIDIRPDGRR
jgi:hypothetical protein